MPIEWSLILISVTPPALKQCIHITTIQAKSLRPISPQSSELNTLHDPTVYDRFVLRIRFETYLGTYKWRNEVVGQRHKRKVTLRDDDDKLSGIRSFQMTTALKLRIKAITSSWFVDRGNNVMTSTDVDPDRDGSTAKCPVCFVRHLERQWFRTSLFHWLLFVQHKVRWSRSLALRRLAMVILLCNGNLCLANKVIVYDDWQFMIIMKLFGKR